MIFLDMDGVLCDFVGAALRLFDASPLLATWPAGEWDVAKVLGVTDAEFWGRIDAQGQGFWAELPEYPWASQLVDFLERIGEVVICTTPSAAHYSAAGKVIWLERHFGGRFARRYVMVRDEPESPSKRAPWAYSKAMLARSGVCLVDDNDRNVERFKTHGGRAVLVPQPWNGLHYPEYRDGTSKFDYVREAVLRAQVSE
jgi:hypothetical protein